jgi:predicted O-methyltransferase YrrM
MSLARVTPAFEFTTDWFTPRLELWQRLLQPLAGRPRLRGLEIGVYEGRATVWLLQHVFTHSTSSLVCIDPFVGLTRSRGQFSSDAIEKRFRRNVCAAGASRRVKLIKASSGEALRTLATKQFDFVYVDGSHRAADVLTDGVLALPLVKPGGILAFDDYLLHEAAGQEASAEYPKVAIDAFLDVFADRLEPLWKGYQVFVRLVR